MTHQTTQSHTMWAQPEFMNGFACVGHLDAGTCYATGGLLGL
jgi:hypothetical protein